MSGEHNSRPSVNGPEGSGLNGPHDDFEASLRREALQNPERRAYIAELLGQLRETNRVSPWPSHTPTGESEIRLYWRVWRYHGVYDGFQVLCGGCAPRGEVEQRKKGVRPARAADFYYLDTLPPKCARCGWVNLQVQQERERAHAAERAWREGGER